MGYGFPIPEMRILHQICFYCKNVELYIHNSLEDLNGAAM